MSDADARAPFIPSWRTKAREFNRRPLLLKQLTFLGLIILIALPLRYFAFNGESSVPYPETIGVDSPPPPPAIGHHNDVVFHDHPPQPPVVIPAHPNYPPLPQDKSSPEPSTRIVTSTPDPMVFSLIIWGEDSAAEGAILLKVHHRIAFRLPIRDRNLLRRSVNSNVYLRAGGHSHYLQRRSASIPRKTTGIGQASTIQHTLQVLQTYLAGYVGQDRA